jgi:hypothetical protein
MLHLPKLFAAATLVFGLVLGLGQAKAAPLPTLNGVAANAAMTGNAGLPVEQVHYRGYRYWGWGYPRYRYNYYYRPNYYGYGYGYRPYWYWNRPYYRRYWW